MKQSSTIEIHCIADDDFEYIEDVKGYQTSKKGQPLLVDLGDYVYVKHRVVDPKVYWRCKLHDKKKCRANVKSLGNKIYARAFEHNHVPNAQ